METNKIIKFENFSFKYNNSKNLILKNINLDINKDEITTLAGPTGCGKSTLLRTINGLIPHMYNGEYNGRILVDGLNVKDVEMKEDNLVDIVLSKNKKEGNWLPLSRDSNLVIVRQTFLDKSLEQSASLKIECFNSPDFPAPLTEERLIQSLQTVSNFKCQSLEKYCKKNLMIIYLHSPELQTLNQYCLAQMLLYL